MASKSFPSTTYSGTVALSVPHPRNRYALCRAVMTRESWPNRIDLFEIFFERTTDGGASFLPIGSSVEAGGVILKRDSNPLLASRIEFSIRDALTGEYINWSGDVQARIVAAEPFDSAVDIDVLDTVDLG